MLIAFNAAALAYDYCNATVFEAQLQQQFALLIGRSTVDTLVGCFTTASRAVNNGTEINLFGERDIPTSVALRVPRQLPDSGAEQDGRKKTRRAGT